MKNLQRGFTLIELLVVIAIIGILSSVVLVSLNSARSKGTDAKVQGTMNGIRSAAEIYYSTNGYYGTATTTCTTGMFQSTDVKPLTDSLAATVTGWNSGTMCVSGVYGYAVSVPLSSGRYQCIDSLGNATSSITSINISSTDTNCN